MDIYLWKKEGKSFRGLTHQLARPKHCNHSFQCPVKQSSVLGLFPVITKKIFHLFCQVDNHDGVAGDRPSRIGRSILDPLPVVHPVDLGGGNMFIFMFVCMCFMFIFLIFTQLICEGEICF